MTLFPRWKASSFLLGHSIADEVNVIVSTDTQWLLYWEDPGGQVQSCKLNRI